MLATLITLNPNSPKALIARSLRLLATLTLARFARYQHPRNISAKIDRTIPAAPKQSRPGVGIRRDIHKPKPCRANWQKQCLKPKTLNRHYRKYSPPSSFSTALMKELNHNCRESFPPSSVHTAPTKNNALKFVSLPINTLRGSKRTYNSNSAVVISSSITLRHSILGRQRVTTTRKDQANTITKLIHCCGV